MKMNKTVMVAMCVAGALGVSSGALAGGTTSLAVTAKVLGKCSVSTAAGTLDFGTIDPSSGANAAATPATFAMKCSNGTVSTAATDDGGLHNSGTSKRMLHSANAAAFLPYSVSYSGDVGFTGAGLGGAAASQTVTVNGTVLTTDFQNASATTGADSYTDTVVITVNP